MENIGLTDQEALRLLAEGKGNEISARHTKPTREIILENTFSANNLIMLAVIACLYIAFAFLQDRRLLMDSVGIVSVFIVNSVVAVFQELRARALLEKARLMLPHTVRVIRSGRELEIPQEQVVAGDAVVLRRGDFAPVDGTIIAAESVEMDESLLTGESLPIAKSAGDAVFSGSFCVAGNCVFAAEKVGDESLAASINHLAKKYKFVATPLQRNLNVMFVASFFVAIAAVIIEILASGNIVFSDVDFIRRAAAVVLALLPGGLIFFSTVTFAVGVWRVSKLGALVQKLNAIESFSSVTTVCMDKTGTLTQNAIAITGVRPLGNYSLDEAQLLLGTFARMSRNPNATTMALYELPADESGTAISETAFSSERKHSVQVIEIQGNVREYVLGAPDMLLHRCESAGEVERLIVSDELRGYRNLLFAVSTHAASVKHDECSACRLQPVALVSLHDPLRTDLDEALALFRKQDIALKILSGDHPDAVYSTVSSAGWSVSRDDVVTGAMLDATDVREFSRMIAEKDIFARLTPTHKLNILRRFNELGIRTAMIGDGVNDVPAIKEAKLGIAMEEGSSMTKEIADIVLLKNKFSLLPRIFSEGNNIISTVLLISVLYLTKNLTVLILSVLHSIGNELLGTVSFTPRRTALLTMVGVAMPAYCIALWNSRTEPERHFFRGLFSTAAASISGVFAALLVTQPLIDYLVSDAAQSPLHCCSVCASRSPEPPILIVMIAVIVYSLIINYLLIALPGNAANRRKFLGAGGIITGVFSVFLWLPIDSVFTQFIHFFYEFTVISPEFAPVIVGAVSMGVAAAMIIRLALAQIFRNTP